MYSGPHIKRDGLVFGYDTGYGIANNDTSTRFYPGEPTENQISQMVGSTDFSYPEVAYRSTATETNVSDSTAPGGKYSRFTGIDDSSNNQLYSRFNTANIDVRNSTITYSVYLKGSGTCHLTIYADNTGYGISSTITLTNNWTRYIYTRAVTNYTTNCWVAVRGILSTTDVFIASQQAEIKSHATPFTTGTRSATQSLIDLTRTYNIDLSNVSFDSNAQMTFDGSDDYIDLPNNLATTLNGNPEASINMWIKLNNQSNGVANTGLIQLSNYNSSNGNLYFYGNGYTYLDIFRTSRVEKVFANNTVTATDWHMLTITTTPGPAGWKCYINGIQKIDTTGQDTVSVNSSIQGGLTLGRNNSSRYTNGNIAVCAIYNRALTAQEVQQNYRAYKNRFDI
jgi:hypothetical protein